MAAESALQVNGAARADPVLQADVDPAGLDPDPARLAPVGPDADPAVIRLEGVLADRDNWEALRCPVDRALQVVGTRSAVLLLREAYYGTRRFDDFAHRVGISEAVAATRLRQLAEAGLLQRRPYREPGQRTRSEYVLSDKGRDFLPVFLALMDWGGTYLSEPGGPPLAVGHRDCGEAVHVEVRCAAGHRVGPGELTVTPTGCDS